MKTRTSTTAQGIAFARALESSRPPGERICYDPLARRLISPAFYLLGKLFAGYAERKAPGVIGFLVARCRYIDDYLQACLETGLDQLVILGAGLDSRAYRFEQLEGHVRVFEVDHPATQQAKLGKLAKIFGELPEHVTYVPIDFNEEALRRLLDFGYSPQVKTLFIWEGVTHYLTAEAVDQTLEFVLKNSGSGSSIIFDYVYTSALTAAHKRGEIIRMQRAKRYTGEGLVFGIEEGQMAAFLRVRGYTQIRNVTSEDLKRLYFTGAKQSRAIAPIYAIAHAAVEGQRP
ncbi:MAG: SAM-dependent methyltransferase [Anaerolineae bacterium]|nr:SAM-dependent methyltransferase [Anaerolineae bacterium]